MIKKEEIETFLGKQICVGVPHFVIPDKLFFYYGKLVYVDYEEIQLELGNGFKRVQIAEIQDIHLNTGRREI